MTLRQQIKEFIDANPDFDGPNVSAIVNSIADRFDALEVRVLALETWKRPKPSPTNEAGGPSDEVPATSVPSEKEPK